MRLSNALKYGVFSVTYVNTPPVSLSYFHRHPIKFGFYLSPYHACSGPFYRPRFKFHRIAGSSIFFASLVVSPRRWPISTNDARSTRLQNVGTRRHIPHKCLAPRRVFQCVRLKGYGHIGARIDTTQQTNICLGIHRRHVWLHLIRHACPYLQLHKGFFLFCLQSYAHCSVSDQTVGSKQIHFLGARQWRTEGAPVQTPPPRNSEGPPKNRAKLNLIVKTVKNCWI